MITASDHQHLGFSAASHVLLIAAAICGLCCIVFCCRFAIAYGHLDLQSVCPLMGSKSAAAWVSNEPHRLQRMDPHAAAVGTSTQSGPHSASLIDFLLQQEERPAIPQKGPRPGSFLAPQLVSEKKMPVPLCFKCNGRMAWSCRCDGQYRQGWQCGFFAACGSDAASRGASRWHCPTCCEDVCDGCAGGPGRQPSAVAAASPTQRPASPTRATPPCGLTPVAPCPEIRLQPRPPRRLAAPPGVDCAPQEAIRSPDFAVVRTWDALAAAGEAPSCHVRISRPPLVPMIW